jgi:Nif-specific regulatory protein
MPSNPELTIAPGMSERTLAALLEASAAVSSSLELPATLQAIARSAAQVLEAEASSVLLLDKARGRLIFKAAVGDRGDVLVGDEFDAKLGIAGRVAASGEPQIVSDARHDPDFFRGIDDKSSFTTRGLIAAPLLFHGEVIGVVEVLNKGGGERFSERDLEILGIFANLAATSVTNAQMHEQVKRDNRGLRALAKTDDPIIGGSGSLKDVLALCDRVAHSNATVLLLGETGTGKELSARAIHVRSPRRGRAFIAINCAALPESLLESELFGHEAGAFTGATAQKMGRFELADGGTLFLDEIGDISPAIQIKLLRVLQEREFVRVGGTKTIACDVRIIAATNRNLKAAMEKGDFRDDLYYRLNVFPIHLPPLRERAGDIPLLVNHFVARMAQELGSATPAVSEQATALMCAYRWPGNIRELRNVIERAVLLCDRGTIEAGQLPREISGEAEPERIDEDVSSLEGYEKAMIVKALKDCNWNQSQAARVLGVSRDNLRYRLKKYNLDRAAAE